MSEQGLRLGEFQLELLLQEHPKLLFLISSASALEPMRLTAKIIGIPPVLESPEIRIAGINCRHLLGFVFIHNLAAFSFPFFQLAIGTVVEHMVLLYSCLSFLLWCMLD